MSDHLYNGKHFASYDDFVVCMQSLQEETGFKYSCSVGSHKLSSRKRDIPNGEKLIYHKKKFSCIFGGKFVAKGQGKRNKNSKKVGCPAGFTYFTPPHGLWAEVADICLDHTCDAQPQKDGTKTKNTMPTRNANSQAEENEKKQVDHVPTNDEFLGNIEHYSSMKLQEEIPAACGQVEDEASSGIQSSSENSTCSITNVSKTLEHLSVEDDSSNFIEPERTFKVSQEDTDGSENKEIQDSNVKCPEEMKCLNDLSGSTNRGINLDQACAMPNKQDNHRVRISRVSEEDPDNFETDNTTESADVKYPQQTRSRGRPVGSTRTAIGLERKRSQGMPFQKKANFWKCSQLLKSMVTESLANLVLNTEYKLEIDDLPEEMELLSDMFMDEAVDVNLLKKYLKPDAFTFLEQLVEKKKLDNHYSCPLCKLESVTDCVQCDNCLLWHHFDCVHLKNAPKAKFWYCPSCRADQ